MIVEFDVNSHAALILHGVQLSRLPELSVNQDVYALACLQV